MLCSLGGYAYIQSDTISTRQNELDQLQQSKKKFNTILTKIKKLEEETQILGKQIGVIKKLKKSSPLTVHALDEVANLTPSKRMWLTSFTQSENSLKLSGMALDNRTIAKYMDDLKASPYIRDVTLVSSSLKAYAGKNLKAFSISCSLTVPEEKGQEQPPETLE